MIKQQEELKDRVEAKKLSMMAKLKEMSADTRHEAREAGASIKKKLSEVEEYVKDGWENLSDSTSKKLNEWLDN